MIPHVSNKTNLTLLYRYVNTLGTLDTYLGLYHSKREELLMRALGSSHPLGSGYKMSVFATWGISIDRLSSLTAKFLYLLCFLDETNLNKDLFRRACTPKAYWDDRGNESILHPLMNRIPCWLLELFCDSRGHWNEFKFNEVVMELSSLFFLKKEEHDGNWLHESGPVDSRALTSTGDPITLLRLPQPLHDLGKYYPDEDSQQLICVEAFFVVMHAFQNDIKSLSDVENERTTVLYVGRGGAVSQPARLARQLDETYRHICAFECHIRAPDDDLLGSLASRDFMPFMDRRCEAIIFASMFLPPLSTNADNEERRMMWNQLRRHADLLLRRPRGGTVSSNASQSHSIFRQEFSKYNFKFGIPNTNLGFYRHSDYEGEWKWRQQTYYVTTFYNFDIIPTDEVRKSMIYHLALTAELQWEAGYSAHEVLTNLKLGIVADSEKSFPGREFIDLNKVFELWKSSDMCKTFIERAMAEGDKWPAGNLP